MKIATLLSAVITTLLVLTTMICGLWIRANSITDPSSFDFHIGAGIASVVFSVITTVLVVVLIRRISLAESKGQMLKEKV